MKILWRSVIPRLSYGYSKRFIFSIIGIEKLFLFLIFVTLAQTSCKAETLKNSRVNNAQSKNPAVNSKLSEWLKSKSFKGLQGWNHNLSLISKTPSLKKDNGFVIFYDSDTIILFSDYGALLGVTNYNGNHDFINSTDCKLSWQLKVVVPNGKTRWITSSDCSEPLMSQNNDVLSFTWEAIGGSLEIKTIWRLDSSGLRGRLEVTDTVNGIGIAEVRFPIIQNLGTSGVTDVSFPFRNWGKLKKKFKGRLSYSYPSCNWPMQFIGLTEGDDSLYIAAEDGGAELKRYRYTAGKKFYMVLIPENLGLPGKGFKTDYDIVIQPVSGNWLTIAKRYRKWAVKQKWCSKGPLIKREDIPKRLRDGLYWTRYEGSPDFVIRESLKTQKRLDVPMANHIYSWHQIPFDNDYPHYNPAKPCFEKIVHALQSAGITLMPYINGRLWDTDTEDFATEGVKGACKNEKGKPYVEVYPTSGQELAPMCPYSKIWQDKIYEIADWLFNTEGVGAIYIDQIGSATQCICMDPSHGHPVGGGKFWVQGYEKLLSRVQELTKNTDRFITTEDTAEPYINVIDGFLIWETRYPDDIPIYAAVYSDMRVVFASQVSHKETPTAFAMKVGRDFMWGGQLGWFREWILLPQFKTQCDFLEYLLKSRLALKEYLAYGEYLGPAAIDSSATLNEVWIGRFKNRIPVEMKAVMGTLWKSSAGQRAIIVANYDNVAHCVDIEVPSGWPVGKILQSDPMTLDVKDAVFNDSNKCRLLIMPRKVKVITFRGTTSKDSVEKLPSLEIFSGDSFDGHVAPKVEIPQGMLISNQPVEVLPRRMVKASLKKQSLRARETVEYLVKYRLAPENKGKNIILHFPKEIIVKPSNIIVPNSNLIGEVELTLTGKAGLSKGLSEIPVTIGNYKIDVLKLSVEKPRPVIKQSKSQPVKVDGSLFDWKDATWIKLDGTGGNRVNKSKWKGPDDLSAEMAVRSYDGMLYLAFRIYDDRHVFPAGNENIWKGDSIQIAIDPLLDSGLNKDANDIDFAAGLTKHGPKLYFWSKKPKYTQVAIRRTSRHTLYEIALPLSILASSDDKDNSKTLDRNIGFSFTVNESDEKDVFEGWIEWTPGICGGVNPSEYGMILGD